MSDDARVDVFDEALIRLMRTLPATWTTVWNSLSALEQKALNQLVTAGIVELQSDVIVKRCVSGEWSQIHRMVYVVSGNEWAHNLSVVAGQDANGKAGDKRLFGTGVFEHRLTALGEEVLADINAHQDAYLGLYRAKNVIAPFKVERRSWEFMQTSGSPAMDGANAGPAPSAKAVYISYKWGDDTDAGRERDAFIDRLDASLQTAGYDVRRDKRNLGYKDSIKEFMDELGQGHCIVVVLSNEYLRARFCMYELVQIFLNHEFRERIVPVVLPDVIGLTPNQRLENVKFWVDQRNQLQQEFAPNLGAISPEGFTDFDRVRQIAHNCDATLSHVFDMNCLNQAQLEANDFQLLKQAIDERMAQPSAKPGMQ